MRLEERRRCMEENRRKWEKKEGMEEDVEQVYGRGKMQVNDVRREWRR
jgi:hypothetical protein